MGGWYGYVVLQVEWVTISMLEWGFRGRCWWSGLLPSTAVVACWHAHLSQSHQRRFVLPCSDDRWATFLRNALTSLAPSIVLSIYNM